MKDREFVQRFEEAAQRQEKIARADGREQAQTAPPSLTAFEDITDRIRGAAERIHAQAHKLEEIGARILGPLPCDDLGKAGVDANPECTLDHTYLALNWLDSALGRLHTAAVRLERL